MEDGFDPLLNRSGRKWLPMRLFICCAHSDHERAESLAGILRDVGHDPWFNVAAHEGIPWQEEVDPGLLGCDGFIYMITRATVASAWCDWEHAVAMTHHKRIFFVILE